MGLEDLKKQAEEGLEKAVEAAKHKATEVVSDLKDKLQK